MRFITTLLVAAGMTLAAFAQTPSTVGVALQPRTSRVVGTGTNMFLANADRAVATLETVARLSTITNAVHGSVVDVRGYDAEEDLPYPMRFTLYTNSVATTNRVIIANAGGSGRWVHDWDRSGEIFGVKSALITTQSDTPTMTVSDSRAALQSAIDYMHELGGGTIHLPAGTIQLSGSVFMRPRVCLVGAGGAANGFVGRTQRTVGLTYLETITTNGFGVPVLVFDGPTYYTNEYNQAFVNTDGDTLTYYSGQNTVRDIVFTCYQVGAGGTNRFPVAGIVANMVDGLSIEKCSFINVRGYGIWAHATRGLRVDGCVMQNCVTSPFFLSYCSDTSWANNVMGGSGGLIYRANTHTFSDNEMWNPFWSSVDYNGTTNVVSYGLSRDYNNYDTQIASATSNTVYQTTGDWKADTGTMVRFVGTNPPTPFVINKPYFLINGPDAKVMKIAESPYDAMAGTAMDITSDSTNGTWRLTGWTTCLYAYQCAEIHIKDQRSDQSYQHAFEFDECTRCAVRDSEIWEIGTMQAAQRADALTGDKLFSGVYLRNCDSIDIIGNKFQGGYNYSSHPENIMGQYYGAYSESSTDVNFVGNGLLSLRSGVYADSGSYNVRAYANHPGGDVLRVADSDNTSGANDRIWAGLNQNGTNPIVSADIPSALTNLTDFTFHINFLPDVPQIISTGDSYNPILSLGGSTNYTGTNLAYIPGTFRVNLFRAVGQTNWSLICDLVGYSNSFLRGTLPLYDHIDSGQPIDLTITRTASTWSVFRSGYFIGLTFTGVGATPPVESAPIYAKNAIIGFWPVEIFRNGWVSEVILLNRASTAKDCRDFTFRAPRTNAVFIWDFKGDTLNTVRDKSGNGVHGTIVNLSTNALHEWGPWYEYNPSPVLTAATVVSNTLNSAKREALSGEAPGLLFRGSGYVTANNLPSIGTSNFTVWSRFVMPSDSNDAQTPWCLSAATNSGNTARTIYLQCLTNGNVEVLLTGSSSSHGLKAIAAGARARHAGQVVDLVFSRSNGTPYISINGTNETLTAGSFGTPPTWSDTVSGTNVIVGTGAQAFRGRIFRTAAWNRALSQEDINSLFANGISDADRWTTPTGAPGAFIDLNLGVGTGTSIPDRSTNAYNGLLVGSAEHVLKN